MTSSWASVLISMVGRTASGRIDSPAGSSDSMVGSGQPEELAMSAAHPSPAQIRSSLNHPVIDGDGHWVEFDPVFAERMRKVGGDLAAEGFLAAMKTTRDALGMSVAERRRRRI